MNRFAIAQPATFNEAASLLADRRFSLPVIKAGGLDVLDHLKEGLVEPDVLINVKRVRHEQGSHGITVLDGADREPVLEIPATATLADIIHSRLARRHAPVLGQSLENAATPQVRNVGTAAGNLLQRPRCWYYRNHQFNCLKKGGHMCFAVEGENRFHAIFGGGPCHIVHPSNLAPALMVCDARVHVLGGRRDSIRIADLFHGPDKGILSEHVLEPGELITHITCEARPHSGFYTMKEKQSFDWPLAMCAAALELDGSVIRSASICAGAVAPIPWRLLQVEQALRGVSVDDDAALRAACARSIEGARPLSQNAYKLKLLPVAVRRAVLRAAGRAYEPKAEA